MCFIELAGKQQAIIDGLKRLTGPETGLCNGSCVSFIIQTVDGTLLPSSYITIVQFVPG